MFVHSLVRFRMFVCLFLCMYVCLHVCLFVCFYACMFVCMFVCLYACMLVCMCLFVCLHVCLFVCFYVCMFVCLFVCMSVCSFCPVLSKHTVCLPFTPIHVYLLLHQTNTIQIKTPNRKLLPATSTFTLTVALVHP